MGYGKNQSTFTFCFFCEMSIFTYIECPTSSRRFHIEYPTSLAVTASFAGLYTLLYSSALRRISNNVYKKIRPEGFKTEMITQNNSRRCL